MANPLWIWAKLKATSDYWNYSEVVPVYLTFAFSSILDLEGDEARAAVRVEVEAGIEDEDAGQLNGISGFWT